MSDETLLPYEEATQVNCDGWSADLGCDVVCQPQEWTGRYGGRNLCRRCAKRLEDEGRAWRWLTG